MRSILPIQEQSLFELFSNFSYKLPKDPELILYDFYFLTSFGKEIEGRNMNANYAIQEASDDIVNMLHIHMKKAVFYAITAEIRHLFDHFRFGDLKDDISEEFYEFVQEYYLEIRKTSNLSIDSTANSLGLGVDLTKISDRDRKILTAEDERGRLISYRAVKTIIKRFGWNNSKFAILAEDVFNSKGWARSYGGKPWAAIAESLYRLERAGKKNEKIVWIDHAYDLQHNTDTVFNKLKLYYKDGGYSWIKRALDWKRDVLSINSFYKKVSIQLRPLVAYVYKITTGKSIISAEDEEENKAIAKATAELQSGDTISAQVGNSVSAFRRVDSKNYDYKEGDVVRIWDLSSYIVADYEVQDWASHNSIKLGTNSFNDLETTDDYKVIAIGEHDKFPGKVIVLIQPMGSDYVYLFDQKGLKKKVFPSIINYKFNISDVVIITDALEVYNGASLWAKQHGFTITAGKSPNDEDLGSKYQVIAKDLVYSTSKNIIYGIKNIDSSTTFIIDEKGLELYSPGSLFSDESSELEYTDVSYASPDWTNVKIKTKFMNFALSNPKFTWLTDAFISGAMFTVYSINGEKKIVLEKGIFRGIWVDGVFENGSFLAGTWKNGIFDGGIWKTGKWIDGKWLSGKWETGEILQDDGYFGYSLEPPE